MTTKNDITYDLIKSKKTNDLYRDNWDRIFQNKESKDDRESGTNEKEKKIKRDDQKRE